MDEVGSGIMRDLTILFNRSAQEQDIQNQGPPHVLSCLEKHLSNVNTFSKLELNPLVYSRGWHLKTNPAGNPSQSFLPLVHVGQKQNVLILMLITVPLPENPS